MTNEPRIAGVVLAAGRSRRMGRPKQLLPLGNHTVLARIVQSMAAGGIAERYVVLMHHGDGVEDMTQICKDHGARAITNTTPDAEMADSVRVARDALRQDPPDGVLIALCDQPLVEPAVYASLINVFRTDSEAIVIPTCDGRRGHPVLCPWAALAEFHAPDTLRDVMAAHASRIRETSVDSASILDALDTPGDYERIAARAE